VFNNVTARSNDDGSFTIHFGGDPGNINDLPITRDWNDAVRCHFP
jgi:hypothetical protein